ncbi:MAG: hypothetical protein ABSG16_12675 [Candidatus Acidiferrum sp.]
MMLLKRSLAGLGSLVLVAIIVALVAPKAVQAVVAAAVQVMNTSVNPVPTYDSGTRFQADLCYANGPVSQVLYCAQNPSASFVVPTVTSSGAAVKRLIVDNVSGICASYNNPTAFIKAVRLEGQFVPDSVANSEPAAAHYVPIVGPAYSYVNSPTAGGGLSSVPETDYSYGQTTRFSFNPGDTVTLYHVFFWPGSSATDGGCYARIDGTLATQ